MKLIYAIVRNDNEDDVVSQLTQHRYSRNPPVYHRRFPEKKEIPH